MKNRYLPLIVIMSMWCMAFSCPMFSTNYNVEHDGSLLTTDSLNYYYYYNKDSIKMTMSYKVQLTNVGTYFFVAQIEVENKYAHTIHIPDTAFRLYACGGELEVSPYFVGCAEERVLPDAATQTYTILPVEHLNFLMNANSEKVFTEEVIDENIDTLNAVFIIQGISKDGKVLLPDTFNLYPS